MLSGLRSLGFLFGPTAGQLATDRVAALLRQLAASKNQAT